MKLCIFKHLSDALVSFLILSNRAVKFNEDFELLYNKIQTKFKLIDILLYLSISMTSLFPSRPFSIV